jgi:hypothetical protein
MSPQLEDPLVVLGVLVHELVHAVDDCRSGHRGAFARIARGVGLEGRMTTSTPGPELAMRLNGLARALGPYPHGALGIAAEPVAAKPTTRLIKAVCPDCGYATWTARKWLFHKGPPVCPDGETMEIHWSVANPPPLSMSPERSRREP